MKFERSKWPTQSTSTPSTAAIASTCSSPRSVSIWAMTMVRAFASAIFWPTSPPR